MKASKVLKNFSSLLILSFLNTSLSYSLYQLFLMNVLQVSNATPYKTNSNDLY